TSENIAEIKQRLMDRFELTDPQAEAIAQMRMYQLSNMERKKIDDELAELRAKIKELTDILGNNERVLEIISDELEEIKKKFGDDRRTSIENVSGEVDVEDLIPVEDCVVTLTDIGYIKRQPVSEYKTQKRGGKGVSAIKQREEDFIQEMFISSSHDDVLFITNKGIMYKLRCYEIPEGSKQSRGVNIINMLPLAEDEKIEAMIKTSDYDEGRFIIMVTKNGKIKRTPLSAYKHVRKNGLRAVGLDEGDEIAGVRLTDGNAQVVVATRNGYAIRIEETQMRPMSRTAHGVKAIKLRDGDYVVSMARVREGASMLTVTEKGLGRRVKLEDYRIQNRGGYGMLNYKVSEEKGYVCGIKIVDEEDDIIMIATDGVIIRIRACDIRIMGRYATGVKLMRVSGDDKVVAFTRAERDEEAETATIEQPSEEELAREMEEAAAAEQAEVIIEEDVPDDDIEETEE
ncbi:MAG: DNA gyrase subunit A, partial [Oscillospiraceae bacterium]|nr:DNA gyrase subunit A [Oscillospiraceae bacterium]